MSERRTLQMRGEVIEEYSRDFPAEIVEIYSRPLPGAVEPVPTEPTPRPRRKKRRVWKGLLILLGVAEGDTRAEADKLVKKIANLRIFEDENGKMNLSLLDIGGGVLVVSQFTLCADCTHGRRPSLPVPPRRHRPTNCMNILPEHWGSRACPILKPVCLAPIWR